MSVSFPLSLLVASRTAAADRPLLQVKFDSPPECIQEDALTAMVTKNLQGAVVSEQRLVRGSVLRSPGGYRFQLQLRDRDHVVGDRVLDTEGEDCHRGDESLALVIAMLLEGPDAIQGSAEEPGLSPVPEASAVDSGRAADEPAEAGSAEEDNGYHFVLGLLFGASSQLQPDGSVGALVSAGIELPFHLSLRAVGGYFAPTSRSLGGYGSVEVSQWFAGGDLCVSPWSRLSWLGACAGARAVFLPAQGAGFPRNAAATGVVGAASVMGRAFVPLGEHWRIGGGAGVVVPWHRVSFVGANATGQTAELHGTGFVAVELGIGAEFTLN